MGIKFYCPNGHKLHVKAFLAGKRAICPKCQARVLVPNDSQAGTVHDEPQATAEDASVILSGADADSVQALGAAAAGGASAIAMAPPAPSSSAVASAPSSPVAAAGGALAGMSSTPASSQPTVHDPIDEAPSAVWYVRPATGGQFGPASGEIMRTWVNEGRVGASSLVWRAGWSEWRSAAAMFPQLGAMLPTPNVALPPSPAGTASGGGNGVPMPVPGVLPVGHVVRTVTSTISDPGSQPPIAPPSGGAARKRRKANDVSLIVSAILLVISVILVVVLIVVWRARSADEVEPAEAPPSNEVSLVELPSAG